jgi:hypothetical protein
MEIEPKLCTLVRQRKLSIIITYLDCSVPINVHTLQLTLRSQIHCPGDLSMAHPILLPNNLAHFTFLEKIHRYKYNIPS